MPLEISCFPEEPSLLHSVAKKDRCVSFSSSVESISSISPGSSYGSDSERLDSEYEEEDQTTSSFKEEILLETVDSAEESSSSRCESTLRSRPSQSLGLRSNLAMKSSKKQAHPGSPKAYRTVSERAHLCRMGFQYRYGCGLFPQDLVKSSKCYAEAAELGCADAMAALAVARIFGIGSTRALDAARCMLRKSLLMGSVDAIEVRALCWMDGTFDGYRNYSSCLHLLTMGVAKNSPACLLWAGFCLEVGLGTTPDMYAAKQAYSAAAESTTMAHFVQHTLPGAHNSEDPWALMKSALYLLHADGNQNRRHLAMDCLQRAAELGLRDAQVYVAICLIKGSVWQKDIIRALFWLQKKAKDKPPHPIGSRLLRHLDGI